MPVSRKPAQRAISLGQHELKVFVKVGKGTAPGLYETLEAFAALRPIRRELIVQHILGHDFVGERDVSTVPELLGEPLHKPLVVGLR